MTRPHLRVIEGGARVSQSRPRQLREPGDTAYLEIPKDDRQWIPGTEWLIRQPVRNDEARTLLQSYIDPERPVGHGIGMTWYGLVHDPTPGWENALPIGLAIYLGDNEEGVGCALMNFGQASVAVPFRMLVRPAR